MKYTKLFLLVVMVLASCAAPATQVPTPTQTATLEAPSPTSMLTVDATPTIALSPTVTFTPDPALGIVEGNFSWQSGTSPSTPINGVTLQLDKHSGEYIKYKVKSGSDGHFVFSNIEPGQYGFGIYMNLQIKERQCESHEYVFSQDLKWLHYATGLKIDVWYDILFSSVDVTVNPGEVTVLDFVLKCP